ncbi:MAG: response regulator [Chitinivibrionales bacterium]|nr:response regulator [Chitinivibrionales bacterium]
MNSSTKHILIADDEQNIRKLLSVLLEERGYTVEEAQHGQAALEILKQRQPDMVISDIHMPYLDGFDLLKIIDEAYPHIKRILMTGYNIDKYLRMIRKHNIGNILAKGVDFNLDEIGSYVDAIMTGDIFGLQRYFHDTAVTSKRISTSRQAREVITEIVQQYRGDDKMYLEIAIDELISNAVYHAILQLTNVSREHWRDDYCIALETAVTLSWAQDSEKMGIAVEDPKGNLRKTDVLKWLNHKIGDASGLQEHGRGLILVRKLIDRFIINIDPNHKTECILLQYFHRNHKSAQKPLLIHEI